MLQSYRDCCGRILQKCLFTFFSYFLNDNRLGHSEVVSGLHVALKPLFELTEIEIKMFEDVILLRLEFYL